MRPRSTAAVPAALACALALVLPGAAPAGASTTFDVLWGSIEIDAGVGVSVELLGEEPSPCIPVPANPNPQGLDMTWAPTSTGFVDATTTVDWLHLGTRYAYLSALDHRPAGWYQLELDLADVRYKGGAPDYSWVDNSGAFDAGTEWLVQNLGIAVNIRYLGQFYVGATEVTDAYLYFHPEFEPADSCQPESKACDALILFGNGWGTPLEGSWDGTASDLEGETQLIVVACDGEELAFQLSGASVVARDVTFW